MTTGKTLKLQEHSQVKKSKANFRLYKSVLKKDKRFMTTTGFFCRVPRASINNDGISENYRFIIILALITSPKLAI